VAIVLSGLAAAVAPSPDTAAQGQAGSCPVEPDACAFAALLNQWLLSGNVDAVAARLSLQEQECPGPEPHGLGGPYPLCAGAMPGERRAGVPIAGLQSEGGVLSTENVKALLRSWISTADLAVSDEYGPGDLQLFTLGCAGIAGVGTSCSTRFTVVFSLIRTTDVAQPTRLLLMFPVERQADGTLRITAVVTSALLGDESGLATALRGGNGTIFTPYPVEPGVYFPWSPPQGAAFPGTGVGIPAENENAIAMFAGFVATFVTLSAGRLLVRRTAS
jgi:hypothetical protein